MLKKGMKRAEIYSYIPQGIFWAASIVATPGNLFASKYYNTVQYVHYNFSAVVQFLTVAVACNPCKNNDSNQN